MTTGRPRTISAAFVSLREVTAMTGLSRDIVIHAPVSAVYAFVDDPRHQAEIYPGDFEVSDVQELPNGGHRNHWKTQEMGIRWEGDAVDVEHVVDERIVSKTKMAGIDTTQSWIFEPRGDETHVTLRMQYAAHTPVIGKVIEKAFARGEASGLERILDTLKNVLEAA